MTHLLNRKYRLYTIHLITVTALIMILVGCSSRSRQGAGQGAAVGGLSGAIGGMVTALVFGGNVGEALAQGAVWGASSGAVSGAMVGAHQDAAEKQRIHEQQTAQLKKKLGDDAFNSLSALGQCKHDIAMGYAKTAAKSSKQEESLAGIWLEILTHVDKGNESAASALYPQLIAKDKRIATQEDAERLTMQTYERLKSLRTEYGFPATCKQ